MISTLVLALSVGYAHPEQLVDTAWVAAHARDEGVRIVDVRRSGFETGHIPGALWLDPESIRDAKNTPSFMLAPAGFEEVMERLGVSDRTHIVLYDDRGGLLAARVWWILHAYGHTNVALLNGGWQRWTAEGRPVITMAERPSRGAFTATLQPQWLATVDEVKAAIGASGLRLLDARTEAEMDGSDTRLSARGGVIPSAVPLYWEDLIDPETRVFKSADALQALFDRRGLKPSDELIAYCWVGHRSAVDLFALRLVGYERVRNYLGSWEEWSSRPDLPTAPFRQ